MDGAGTASIVTPSPRKNWMAGNPVFCTRDSTLVARSAQARGTLASILKRKMRRSRFPDDSGARVGRLASSPRFRDVAMSLGKSDSFFNISIVKRTGVSLHACSGSIAVPHDYIRTALKGRGSQPRRFRCPRKTPLALRDMSTGKRSSVRPPKFITKICHPDRSEAEWRDPVFSMVFVTRSRFEMCREFPRRDTR